MNKKIFSIPLNPKLKEEEFSYFIEFIKKYNHLIYDIYFTCRIPPFIQDAMGDVYEKTDYDYIIDTALYIQEQTQIPISATFNNTTVRPDQQNLDKFIFNFKSLYDKGIKTVTIPHSHWLATGQIQHLFPELQIKNTILRDVRTASEIIHLSKIGFDYINLDRDLMRDRDTLSRLYEAKKWVKDNLNKTIKFSLLANEGCVGNCPMMVEHFEYNNTRNNNHVPYFADPISRISCPKWDFEDSSISLKIANLPPWKTDWLEFINLYGIDVFKMHGRESTTRLFETLEIIKRWDENEEFLYSNFDDYCKSNNLSDKQLNTWRNKIKNCKFDCWECKYCDSIYENRSNLKHPKLAEITAQAVADSGIPHVWVDIPGLSSPRVHSLLNNIAKNVGTYLEIGSGLGSTAASVLTDNLLYGYFVDDWQNDYQPAKQNFTLPKNSKEAFLSNIRKYKGNSKVIDIESDMLAVNLALIDKKIQMFFYDGPKDVILIEKVLQYYYQVLDDTCVLIFDDTNDEKIIQLIDKFLEDCGAFVSYKKHMLGLEEDKNGWWNGISIFVINK